MSTSLSVSELRKVMETPDQERSPGFFRKIWIRFKTRAKITWSYKLYFFTRYVRVLLDVIIYAFFSFIVLPGALSKAFGGVQVSYVAFSAVGIATARLINTSFRGLGRIIRREQQKGTIEAVLSTKTSFYVILLGDLLYYYLYASSFFLLAIFVGSLIKPEGFVFTFSSISSAIVLVILACFAHLSLALLSAAAILQFKEASPVTRAINWLQRFLGGMFFPITLLPKNVQWISNGLPLAWSLKGIRYPLLVGASLFHPVVMNAAIFLILFGLLVFPIGVFMFQRVYNRVRRSGTLAEY